MENKKKKVYLYTCVSTLIQVDGYSLDAQKSKMKAFCEYNDYEIAGDYEDAGKSGKSIEGRIQFNRMLEDMEFYERLGFRKKYHYSFSGKRMASKEIHDKNRDKKAAPASDIR